MTDGFGRTVDYMRISITDRCNLRCSYCMPKEPCWLPKEELLKRESEKSKSQEANPSCVGTVQNLSER